MPSVKPHPLVGKSIQELPTPALIIDRDVLLENVRRLHNDVEELNIDFRPHVKTLKSSEATRLMLQEGKYRKIIASTVAEIEGVLTLVDEGLIDECLYGLPIYPGVLPRLSKLSERTNIVLMVDNETHVDVLEQFVSEYEGSVPDQWNCFIKINVGSHRAGAQITGPRLKALIQRVESSTVAKIYGFYCHAGHSYSCRTAESTKDVLRTEVDSIRQAAALMSTRTHVVVSVGATPTAHVIKSLTTSLPSHCSLELHAGNFIVNDLQQVSTGLVGLKQQAIRILAEVCSVYPERNEALVNAGVIALSRETSAFPGFGLLENKSDWAVVRVSQEHGIIGRVQSEQTQSEGSRDVERDFKIGEKVLIYCQHACITAAAFREYMIVNDRDVVVDVWTPWKFW